MPHLQGRATRGTFAASEDIAGALPAWPIWLPGPYLQPLLSLEAALLHTHAITKSISGAGTLPGAQSADGESPGKAQTLPALCNPHLPEPGEVLEPRHLDGVRSAAPLHSTGSKAGESSLSSGWGRQEFVGTEGEGSSTAQHSSVPACPALPVVQTPARQ